MKKILLSLVALVCATVSFAQSSLLATLSHDGTIKTFYGTTALKQALDNAEHGDAITLSAGQFLAANITKAVTLRGAGMSINNDSINSHEATLVQGDLVLEIADSVAQRLLVEGVYFTSTITYKGTVRNPLFMKSRFQTLVVGKEGQLVNSTFIHCRIAHSINLSSNSNANMVNCVVWSPYNDETTGSNFEFDNCIIQFTHFTGGNVAGRVINSYYKNCFIMAGTQYAGSSTSYAKYCIPYSCVALNCVGCSNYGGTHDNYNNIFHHMSSKNSTNINVATPSAILKTGGFNYQDNETYELTDEAKTKYLGTDGKEIGLYGGSLPYEENPTTPQITKCNVAAKSTADGKLSVDIEVKAADY